MNFKMGNASKRASTFLAFAALLQLILGVVTNNLAVQVGGGTALAHSLFSRAVSSFQTETVVVGIRMLCVMTASATIVLVGLRMIETNFGFVGSDKTLVDFAIAISYTSLTLGLPAAAIAMAVDFLNITGILDYRLRDFAGVVRAESLYPEAISIKQDNGPVPFAVTRK